MTVCDAQGFGRQQGRMEMFRGHEYTTTLLRKVVLEIVVNDDFLDRRSRRSSARPAPARRGPSATATFRSARREQAIQIDDAAAGRGP